MHLRSPSAAAPGDHPEGIAPPDEDRNHEIVLDRLRKEQSLREPVLGNVANPGSDRIGGFAKADLVAFEKYTAAVGRRNAGERKRQFVAPGIEQAGNADDLALAQRQGHVCKKSGS